MMFHCWTEQKQMRQTANRCQVILGIISVLLWYPYIPARGGGGGGWDRKIGSSRPSSAIQQVQRQLGIREILSQNARKEGRKHTGMLSLSCLPGPASVINHFLVCLRGFYFIDYFKRQSQPARSEILLNKIIQYTALLIVPERMIAGVWNDDRQKHHGLRVKKSEGNRNHFPDRKCQKRRLLERGEFS